MSENPLVVVAGPTGSGKSELGLTLAAEFQGEIVNCDSVQVYRGLEIGSAKTPLSQRRGIRHHLLDLVGPEGELTAGDYSRVGRLVLAAICGQTPVRLPIVVGGTGFYLRALLEGLSEAPGRDVRLRNRLGLIAARRPQTLHRLLSRIDESAATRIHPNDVQKLVRAVEMMLIERQPLGAIQGRPRQPLCGYRILKLGLMPERSLLYARIEARCERMFELGLLDETERLLAAGYSSESKALMSLGYKQALDVLAGAKTTEEALAELKVRTRQYAKRQLTWFRADHEIHWLTGFGSEAHLQKEAKRLVQDHLGA